MITFRDNDEKKAWISFVCASMSGILADPSIDSQWLDRIKQSPIHADRMILELRERLSK